MKADTYTFQGYVERLAKEGDPRVVAKLIYQWVKQDKISPDQMVELSKAFNLSEKKYAAAVERIIAKEDEEWATESGDPPKMIQDLIDDLKEMVR